MHDTAYEIGRQFFRTYLDRINSAQILDVGSLDVNGTLRSAAPAGAIYTGMDLAEGPGVDLVLTDPHVFPLGADKFDAVVSSSCFEHDDMFWVTFLEMVRVTKHGGYIYLNAPSNGGYHRYPIDSWRFYPDAGAALCAWANKQGHPVQLAESFIARRKTDNWNDCIIILSKGKEIMTDRMQRVVDYFPKSYNIRRSGVDEVANASVATEDMILLSSERQKNEALKAQNEALALQVWKRSLPSLSAAPRTRLFTTFGTLVYLDTASGELRHGAIASSPENVVFVADPGAADAGRHGWLMHAVSDTFEPITSSADGCQTISHAKTKKGDRLVPPTLLELVPLDRGLIALKGGTAFLCAEPHGAITLSRTRCSVWECFAPSQDWWTTAVASETNKTGSMADPSIDWQAIRSFAPTYRNPQQGHTPAATSNIGENKDPFARRRVLVIGHRGNLANKMFQYMGALTLARRIKGCAIVNVSLPEWGIEIPDDTQHQQFFDNLDLWTWDPFRPHVQEICAIANKSPSIRIMMADHLLRMEFLESPEFYNGIFLKNSDLYHKVTDNELLINIRAGEILDGVPHYPLVPIAFYEEVVAKTGLNPVFVGQLDSSEYVAKLKLRFPEARFINSQGARADFDLIRSAKNIVVAVSTFSWLAAWLSEADNIFLPPHRLL